MQLDVRFREAAKLAFVADIGRIAAIWSQVGAGAYLLELETEDFERRTSDSSYHSRDSGRQVLRSVAPFVLYNIGMRVLFSSMRMVGHVRPLLPYAHALLRRGHKVLFATPLDAEKVVRRAGLDHAAFGHPGDAAVGEISRSFGGMPREQVLRTAVTKIFAGINARAALPGLRSIIQTWKPDLIVRESMEFASMLAAIEAKIPTARVASTNAKAEARIPILATEPLDAISQEAGLHTDSGSH